MENDKRIIGSALQRVLQNHSRDFDMHIIITGWCTLSSDLSSLRLFLKNHIIEHDCNSLMLTDIYMYRELLISKEKMVQFCTGKCYRQFHHKTDPEKEFYKESINDDIDSFFEYIKLGHRNFKNWPEGILKWTYFLPELTMRELELVENKDEEYFKNFKWSSNPDVDEAEMKESTSSSKYVGAFCRRETTMVYTPTVHTCVYTHDGIYPHCIYPHCIYPSIYPPPPYDRYDRSPTFLRRVRRFFARRRLRRFVCI